MRIKDTLNDEILAESIYRVAYHVVSNIFRYLMDRGFIDNYPGTKKGKYIIKNEDGIKSLINKN